MNNEGFISSQHVFDRLIHDLIKRRKFNCVSRWAAEFHLHCRGEPRNLPNSPRNLSNFVGPTWMFVTSVCITFLVVQLDMFAPSTAIRSDSS